MEWALAKLCPATEGALSAGDKASPAEAKAVCKYDSTNRVDTTISLYIKIMFLLDIVLKV